MPSPSAPARDAPPRYRRDPSSAAESLRQTEWLLTNGIGGYAMGTALGVSTRRYHGLLVGSIAPPVQRELLLHSLVETVILDAGTPRERSVCLANYRFRGMSTDHPEGYRHCVEFSKSTSCRWLFRVGDAELVKTLHLYRDRNAVAVEYTVRAGPGSVRLHIRPLLGIRDSHGLLRQDNAGPFHVEPAARSARVSRGDRTLDLSADRGAFETGPQWWYGLDYEVEKDRGYDHEEDLFSPGEFSLLLRPGASQTLTLKAWLGDEPGAWIKDAAAREQRISLLCRAAERHIPMTAGDEDRKSLARLVAASDDFLVGRGTAEAGGASVIAGYPWFSDWGRDTMIALPGLCLYTGRFTEARRILQTFAAARRNGLIPNLFNDRTGEAEYNTVDASLWFLHAACEYLRLSGDRAGFEGPIREACLDIIEAYRAGTDHGIKMDPADGLIAAGDPSSQLTWMDAKRDGVVFTPRHGKPVEINALWHHGLLSVAGAIQADDPARAAAMRAMAATAAKSFSAFWNPVLGCCHDVLVPAPGGRWLPDPAVRPNQVFAASLEHSPLSATQRAAVVKRLRDDLLTPAGLRTLAASDPGYRPHYRGRMMERDAAYHNGTVWPWLLGAYAEAVLRVGGFSDGAKAEARSALRPIVSRLDGESLGQIFEVYDAEGTPQRPGGCPAQAWSVAEVLRAWLLSL